MIKNMKIESNSILNKNFHIYKNLILMKILFGKRSNPRNFQDVFNETLCKKE